MPTETSDHVSSELESRLRAIESGLIEQEHRPISAILRYFQRKKEFPDENDPRRFATTKGLIFALLFSPATFAMGGVVFATASVGILVWQTLLIKENNELIRHSLITKDTLFARILPGFIDLRDDLFLKEWIEERGPAFSLTLPQEKVFQVLVLCRGESPYVLLDRGGMILETGQAKQVAHLAVRPADGRSNVILPNEVVTLTCFVERDSVTYSPFTGDEAGKLKERLAKFKNEDLLEFESQVGLFRILLSAVSIDGSELVADVSFVGSMNHQEMKLQIAPMLHSPRAISEVAQTSQFIDSTGITAKLGIDPERGSTYPDYENPQFSEGK